MPMRGPRAHILLFISAAAVLAYHAWDEPALPAWTAIALQCPALLLVGGRRYGGRAAHPAAAAIGRRREATLAMFVAAAALGMTLRHGDPRGASAATLFLILMVLLDAAATHCRRITDSQTPIREVITRSARLWLWLVQCGTVLLALPAATHPAVPDYGHNFWRHVTACAMSAASAVSLNGTTVYVIGDDLRPFGQAVVFALIVLGHGSVLLLGWRALQPWLSAPLSPWIAAAWILPAPLLLALAGWAAFGGAGESGGWLDLSYFIASLGQAGLCGRQDGIAPMVREAGLFWLVLASMTLGAIGPVVLLDRLRAVLRRRRASAVSASGADVSARRGEFLSIELHAGLWLLVIAAGFMMAFESEGLLPRRLYLEQPLDLGANQVTLRDLPPIVQWRPGPRWRAALLMSASARSAGLSVTPLVPGAISWPTWALLVVVMFVGGAVGSAAGGVGTGSIAAAIMPRTFRAAGAAVATYRARWMLVGMAAVHVLAALLLWSAFRGASLWSIVFDSVSLVSGVGWNCGLLPHLPGPWRVPMIGLMLLGRMWPIWTWCRIADDLADRTPRRASKSSG